MLSKKQAALVTVLMTASLVLSACGPAPTPVVETVVVEKPVVETVVVEEIVTPAPPTGMAEDQTLRYVAPAPEFMEPGREAGGGRFIIAHVWMPLFLRDYEHNLKPWLASGYEVSEDGTVYTVHINPKAVWSDGSPVMAKEAADYWAWVLNPDNAARYPYFASMTGFTVVIEGAQAVVDGEAEEISGIVARDDKTLEFHLTGPDPLFVQRLAFFNTGFAKMEDVTKDERFFADGTARVNGPFMIKVWDYEKYQFEIVQNPNWWGEKKPLITRIVLQMVPDENISTVMWMNDEVDIAFWMGSLREQVRKREPGVFYLIPYGTNFYFIMDSSKEPFDDVNVRRALVHAVDWEKAIHAAWEGYRDERVMTSFITPEMPCYKKDTWPDWGYDPAKARAELAQSRYGGTEVLPKIRITPAGTNPNWIRTAEVMMEMWKENLGITNVELRPGWADAWGEEADLVQVYRTSYGAIMPDSGLFLKLHWDWYSDPNAWGYVDNELTEMIAELQVMPRDAPEYCTKVQEAEARMLGHYLHFPMIWDLYEYAAKPWVKNFDTNVDNNWATLLDMYIEAH